MAKKSLKSFIFRALRPFVRAFMTINHFVKVLVSICFLSIGARVASWITVFIFVIFSSVSPVYSFNIGEEREVGEKLLYTIRSSFQLIDDPDITQYISNLGETVLEVAGIQYFDYHFFIIDNREFNAFAAPSGLIFFHSGLIGAMNSENELVSVLAHEIGHIVKRHLAARVEKGKYTSIASLGLALAALAFGGSAAPALFQGALATGQSLNLHYSRMHEEEADLLAYSWMKNLNRSPEGQARMLETMRRIARYRSDKLPQYLLTHPNPEARLSTIEALLDVDQSWVDELEEATDDFEFLRFKYRILSQVKEASSLRPYFASVLSNSRASQMHKTMAKYGMAQIAKNENDFDQSLNLLKEVIEQYPNKTILKVDKAAVEVAAGLNEKAERTLRVALRVNNSDMYGTFLLAKLLARTGRNQEAEKYFQAVMYELPEYSKVYFELGQLASIEGSYGISNFYLGKFNLYEGKLPLAVSNFKAAIKDDGLSEEMKNESKKLLKKIRKISK